MEVGDRLRGVGAIGVGQFGCDREMSNNSLERFLGDLGSATKSAATAQLRVHFIVIQLRSSHDTVIDLALVFG
jgi:hypothetical protein